MSAYHSTKIMRDKVRVARDRAVSAHAHAVKNLSPNAPALYRITLRLEAILKAEEAVTYAPKAPEAPAAPLTVADAQKLLDEAKAREAAAAQAADVEAQAAALAAAVDARLAAE